MLRMRAVRRSKQNTMTFQLPASPPSLLPPWITNAPRCFKVTHIISRTLPPPAIGETVATSELFAYLSPYNRSSTARRNVTDYEARSETTNVTRLTRCPTGVYLPCESDDSSASEGRHKPSPSDTDTRYRLPTGGPVVQSAFGTL